MGKHALTVVVAVIIGVTLLLYMFAFTVSSSQIGLVLTFGNPADKPVEAGYHFKWPWPIQEVRTFDSRIFADEGRFTETRTGDGFNIVTSLLVGWKVDNVLTFNNSAFGRLKPEERYKAAWNSLQPIVAQAAQGIMGTRQLQDLVSFDKEPKYDAIEDAIVAEANRQATATYGIKVELVKVKRLELPESVAQKVYERMNSERNNEARNIEETGQARASEIRSAAKSQSDQILAMARSEADKIRGEGDAKAKEYYQVFAKYPDLEIYLRKLRAMKVMLKEKTTFVLDVTMPPLDVLVQDVPGSKKAGTN